MRQPRCKQRIDMILQRCNIHISNYISRGKNKSYRKVVDDLIKGERSADELVRLIHGRTINRRTRAILRDLLEGDIEQGDIDMLIQYTQMLNMYNTQKQQCLVCMIEICEVHYTKPLDMLLSIQGIKAPPAVIIISEIGTNMALFPTAAAIVSWAGLRPHNDQSAGKIKSRKITHGNKYLRKALMECAWGAARTINSVFFNRFTHLKSMKKNNNAIIVAIARKMLVIIWTLFSKDEFLDKDYHLKKLPTRA